MENIQDTMRKLKIRYSHYPWFANHIAQNTQLHNSIVVYVHSMDPAIENCIPQVVDGFQIRVHFIGSTKILDTTPPKFNPVAFATSLLQEDVELTSLVDVHHEVWKLKTVCGADALIDIFYELIDKDDAVTSLSEKFPTVRAELQKLYDEFGFDVLFEEIDV